VLACHLILPISPSFSRLLLSADQLKPFGPLAIYPWSIAFRSLPSAFVDTLVLDVQAALSAHLLRLVLALSYSVVIPDLFFYHLSLACTSCWSYNWTAICRTRRKPETFPYQFLRVGACCDCRYHRRLSRISYSCEGGKRFQILLHIANSFQPLSFELTRCQITQAEVHLPPNLHLKRHSPFRHQLVPAIFEVLHLNHQKILSRRRAGYCFIYSCQ